MGRQCDPDTETDQGPAEAAETPGPDPASQGKEPISTGCGFGRTQETEPKERSLRARHAGSPIRAAWARHAALGVKTSETGSLRVLGRRGRSPHQLLGPSRGLFLPEAREKWLPLTFLTLEATARLCLWPQPRYPKTDVRWAGRRASSIEQQEPRPGRCRLAGLSLPARVPS